MEKKSNNCFAITLFENQAINQTCSFILWQVYEHYRTIAPIIICGSIAKVLSGILDETYRAKDLDFVVRDYFIWKFLEYHLPIWYTKENVKIISNERVILYTDSIAIEFWAGANDKRPTKTAMLLDKINPKQELQYIDYKYTNLWH